MSLEAGGGIPCRPNPPATLLVLQSVRPKSGKLVINNDVNALSSSKITLHFLVNRTTIFAYYAIIIHFTAFLVSCILKKDTGNQQGHWKKCCDFLKLYSASLQ